MGPNLHCRGFATQKIPTAQLRYIRVCSLFTTHKGASSMTSFAGNIIWLAWTGGGCFTWCSSRTKHVPSGTLVINCVIITKACYRTTRRLKEMIEISAIIIRLYQTLLIIEFWQLYAILFKSFSFFLKRTWHLKTCTNVSLCRGRKRNTTSLSVFSRAQIKRTKPLFSEVVQLCCFKRQSQNNAFQRSGLSFACRLKVNQETYITDSKLEIICFTPFPSYLFSRSVFTLVCVHCSNAKLCGPKRAFGACFLCRFNFNDAFNIAIQAALALLQLLQWSHVTLTEN